jgi:hypothetical protein
MGIWGDGAGAIYTSGATNSYSTEGSTDVVVIRWDAVTGDQVWNATWGTSNADYGRIWGTAAGDLFVAGYENNQLFLTKWDTEGTLVWNQSCPEVADANMYPDLTVNATGHVIIAFGSNVACYDGDGQFCWVAPYADTVYLMSIWLGGDGLVYAAGLENLPSEQIEMYQYLCALTQGGEPLWSTTWGVSWLVEDTTVAWAQARGIWRDNSNSLFVAGFEKYPEYAFSRLTVARFINNTVPDVVSLDGGELSYVVGTIGINATWTITDDTVGASRYEVFIGLESIKVGVWASGDKVSVPVENRPVGTHQVRLLVEDGLESEVWSNVRLEVLPEAEDPPGDDGEAGNDDDGDGGAGDGDGDGAGGPYGWNPFDHPYLLVAVFLLVGGLVFVGLLRHRIFPKVLVEPRVSGTWVIDPSDPHDAGDGDGDFGGSGDPGGKNTDAFDEGWD